MRTGAFEFKQLGGSCYIKIWEIMDIVELSDDKKGNGAMKNAER